MSIKNAKRFKENNTKAHRYATKSKPEKSQKCINTNKHTKSKKNKKIYFILLFIICAIILLFYFINQEKTNNKNKIANKTNIMEQSEISSLTNDTHYIESKPNIKIDNFNITSNSHNSILSLNVTNESDNIEDTFRIFINIINYSQTTSCIIPGNIPVLQPNETKTIEFIVSSNIEDIYDYLIKTEQ